MILQGLRRYKSLTISNSLYASFVVSVFALNYYLIKDIDQQFSNKSTIDQTIQSINTWQSANRLNDSTADPANDKLFLSIIDQFEAINLNLGNTGVQSNQTIDSFIPQLNTVVASLNSLKNNEISATEPLLAAGKQLQTKVNSLLEKKSSQLQLLQFAAIAMCFMGFIGLLAQLAFHVNRQDEHVEIAKVETDNILKTVTEGLFLLDKEMQIGYQQSKALSAMFGFDTDLEGDFHDFIGKLVPESTATIAKDFIELLFGDRVKEKLIAGINPLTEVEISIERRDGSFENKFLKFQFKRVFEGKKLSHLLVSVTDVTREINLARELESTKEQQEAQFDLLMNILHIESDQLILFLQNTRESLDAINTCLKREGHSKEQCMQKLIEIFRHTHRIKGESAALELHTFEIPAHEFEDCIDKLRIKPDLKAKDLLSLTMQLKELYIRIDAVKTLASKLSNVKGAIDSSLPNTHDNMNKHQGEKTINTVVQEIAKRHGKSIMLTGNGLDDSCFPSRYKSPLKDICIQLIRNAVVHGIEVPSQRVSSGKSSLGNLAVNFNDLGDKGYELIVRDDGGGLDTNKIVDMAIQKAIISANDVDKLTAKSAMGLIFKSGVSTQEDTNLDAGRGVGLDVVKSTVESLGGRLSLSTSKGKYCEFRVRLPSMFTAVDQLVSQSVSNRLTH